MSKHSDLQLAANSFQATQTDLDQQYRVDLLGSQKCFWVQAGETVLSASKRAKLALPYSCLSGRCGSCAAKVVSGSWHYENPIFALSVEEHKDHALLCQAHADSDLQLMLREVDRVAELPIETVSATLVERISMGLDVLQIKLQLDRKVTYLAGQYLEFVLDDGKHRPFSIASAPNSQGVIELHVRKVAGGGFTQQLFEQGELGSRFNLELPHGTFVARADSDRPVLFVAGGTGFAPIKALLEHFAANVVSTRPRAMHLYWGAREARDFYLLEKIAAFQTQIPGLKFTRVLSEEASFDSRYGNLHDAVLEDHPNLMKYDVYMSGPPAMISACRQAFLHAALPEERLYFDSFDFAPDVLAALIQNRAKANAQVAQTAIASAIAVHK